MKDSSLSSYSLKKAQKKYEGKIVRKTIKFNLEHEEDVKLLEKLNKQNNISKYIKKLIKDDKYE